MSLKIAVAGEEVEVQGSNIFIFFVCLVCLTGGAVAGVYGIGWLVVALWFIGGVGMLWTVGDNLWERHNEEIWRRAELVSERSKFATVIANADTETRHMLAREWPEMGMEFDQDALLYILEDGVNTGVALNFLQAFLIDSTENAFVDLRNYNDDKYLQDRFDVSREAVRTQWRLTTDLLARKGFLKPDSMIGNHTWQWTSRAHYQQIRRRYMNVRAIPQGNL